MDMYRALLKVFMIGFISLPANAASIDVTPSDCVIGVNCETAEHQGSDKSAFPILQPLDLLYQSGPNDGEESGALLIDSYSAVFFDDPTTSKNNDYAGASITFDGGGFATCSISEPCYLVARAGNLTPGRYLFNLALSPFDSDGKTTLDLAEFWEGDRSLKHVAIFGSVSPVPVPAAIWLFGTALIGFIGFSRRTSI